MTDRQRRILAVWRETEDLDPDISTGRLIALTMDLVPASHDEVLDAIEAENREEAAKGERGS